MKTFNPNQNSIFDLLDKEELKKVKAREKKEAKKIDVDILNLCVVYLVFNSGKNGGNLYLLTKEDAIKLCSDDCSKGKIYSGEYIYMWTSLKNFINKNKCYDDVPEFVFKKDNGSRKQDFERLKIKEFTEDEIKKIINEIGYKLIYK